MPTHGGFEICDGRDNDCSGAVDEGGVCPTHCSGLAWGGHGYMLCTNTNKWWPDCRSVCLAQGMDLVVVDTAAEDQFVTDLAVTRRMHLWLGATDEVLEGDRRRVDETPFWNGDSTGGSVGGAYTNWRTGEPDDNDGTMYAPANCAAIWYNQPSGWADEQCTLFMDYICEAP